MRPELAQYQNTEYQEFFPEFKYFLPDMLQRNLGRLSNFKLLTYMPNLLTLIISSDFWKPTAPELTFDPWFGSAAQYNAPLDIMNGHCAIEGMAGAPGF